MLVDHLPSMWVEECARLLARGDTAHRVVLHGGPRVVHWVGATSTACPEEQMRHTSTTATL